MPSETNSPYREELGMNIESIEVFDEEHLRSEIEYAGLSVTQPKVVEGRLRKTELVLPEEIHSAPGISIFGRTVRSLVFSTDLAIIRNCNADAVLAVYPFTCQPVITKALLQTAERPVLTGVAGSVTTGMRSVELAVFSEMMGASGVVVNLTTKPATIRSISRNVDIPVVLTIGHLDDDVRTQIESGAAIVNVAGGRETADLVAQVRACYPQIPIIASGGPTGESVSQTILAGADAISWTPPSLYELEREMMKKNRAKAAQKPVEATEAAQETISE